MPSALLQALSAATPTGPALRDGRHEVTYGALASLLQGEIGWLQAAGLTRHAVLADNGVPWALADLALHLGEFLAVPLPHAFTAVQCLHALEAAGVEALLTDDLERARALLPGWLLDGRAPASGLYRLRSPLEAPHRPAVPAATRKITFTSGSTATPKGVCLAGSALETVAASLVEATRELEIERHLCLLPLATLLENVAGLYAPLLRGATSVLPACKESGIDYRGLDVRRLLGTLERYLPQSLILVPELLQALVIAAERGWRVPDSLRFIAVGGARVSPQLLERASAVGLPAYEGYGLSECASVVSLNTPAARRAGTVGRPLPHAQVRLDAAGEVHVAGASMLGYLGDPASTEQEIATGDLGRFDDDGYLALRGRVGNRFITSFGRNVSPEWIESEIAQRLGGQPVLACGEARPYVVVLVGGGTDVDDSAIERAVAAANAALPSYAQVRRWARAPQPFSFADGTLTSNGRLRRIEIHARCATLIDALYSEDEAQLAS